jgi:hypothetical protein
MTHISNLGKGNRLCRHVYVCTGRRSIWCKKWSALANVIATGDCKMIVFVSILDYFKVKRFLSRQAHCTIKLKLWI